MAHAEGRVIFAVVHTVFLAWWTGGVLRRMLKGFAVRGDAAIAVGGGGGE